MPNWIKTAVRRSIAEALVPALSVTGFRFKKSASVFARKIDGGSQELSLAIIDCNPVFKFSLSLCVRLDSVQDITNKFSGAPVEYHETTLTSITQLEHLGLTPNTSHGAQFTVRSESELIAILPHLTEIVRSKVMPFFEKYITIDAINEGLNPPGAERDAFERPWPCGRQAFDATNYPYRAMTAIVVAHLAKDPRFSQLLPAYRSQLRYYAEVDRMKFENVVLHLQASH